VNGLPKPKRDLTVWTREMATHEMYFILSAAATMAPRSSMLYDVDEVFGEAGGTVTWQTQEGQTVTVRVEVE